jgi:hypothetical protein
MTPTLFQVGQCMVAYSQANVKLSDGFVICPVCEEKVKFAVINAHIDASCSDPAKYTFIRFATRTKMAFLMHLLTSGASGLRCLDHPRRRIRFCKLKMQSWSDYHT